MHIGIASNSCDSTSGGVTTAAMTNAPIVVIVLVAFNIVTLEKLREWRSYVIVGAFVIAAVVTPPDVLSQLLLAIPMCILYEVGLFAARFIAKPQTRAEADAAEAEKTAS